MTIPFTSISLGFHSQIDPTRTELHQDTAGTFARFNITPAIYRAFLKGNMEAESKTVEGELATAERMLKRAVEIEEVSKKIRDGGGNQAVDPLPELINDFLKMAASWVAAEVALGLELAEPDQPIASQPGELIRRMYLLLYSDAFRQSPDPGKFDRTAWEAVLKAVQKGSAPFDELLPHCRTLCGQVADEFIASLWPFVW
jgi:hypothetical protein